ncbi:MAG: FAD-dependent oxidoreductase [Anaerolineae bacterium]|nr:FAD-dependent oxidoreductase [Anaerolineae bacterium]
MQVGIVGGGLMAVTLAYYLARDGKQVTILEQDTSLGGINGQLVINDHLSIPRFQHALMPTDNMVRELCTELGLEDELVFQSARAGFLHQGSIHPMSNIFDFLSFPVLGIRDRFRLGRTILQARRTQDWESLDAQPVKDWLIKHGGTETFERIWRPLLEAKFDWVYDNISATYIWAWLNRMSAIRQGPQLQGSVGYLRRGHYSLIHALSEALLRIGGKIEYQTRVREIEIAGGRVQRVRTQAGSMEFDVVVAAVATPVFSHLIPAADAAYLTALSKIKYLGLICPVMLLDRPLSPYWTLNLTDPSYPFATIIETPHPVYPDYHIVYLPRYTAPDNDWMGVSDVDIREAWVSHLKMLFPDFNDTSIIHFAVNRSRYVEPVHSTNSLEKMIAVSTPYEGLFMVNSSQVYPQLATSEATIKHAHQVAAQISAYKPVTKVTT